MGRDLSTPPSAFHSDTFISAHGVCPDRPVPILSGRSRPCRDPIGVTAHHCFKSFSCNTYGSPRKCCKQKTYGRTNPFRCNTYKKPGVGAVESDRPPYGSFNPTSHLPYVLQSSVFRNPFVCHSCENCRMCTNNSHSGTVDSELPDPNPYSLSTFNSSPGGILWVAL